MWRPPMAAGGAGLAVRVKLLAYVNPSLPRPFLPVVNSPGLDFRLFIDLEEFACVRPAPGAPILSRTRRDLIAATGVDYG